MKKLMSLVLSVIILTLVIFTPVCSAATEIYYDGAWHKYNGNLFKLKVAGELLDCQVPPIVFNDYSVVPARDVFEKLGAEVLWRGATEQVIINYNSMKIILYINSIKATVNGEKKAMQIAPKIINGKTMIPARFVAETLGFDVTFDGATDTISISEKKKENEKENDNDNEIIEWETVKTYQYSVSEKGVKVTFNLSSENIEYKDFVMTEPDRIILDLTGVKRAVTVADLELESPFLTKIRFGQHEDKLRVVFDIPEAQKYKTEMTGKKLVLTIGDVKAEEVSPDPSDEPSNEPDPVPQIVIEPSRSITIDPGHGGSDPGACFTDEEGVLWRETDINLAVSLLVRDYLEKEGVKVIMTRTKETDVVRRERPELANEKETALFISIHTNAVEENTIANGIETWGSLNLTTDVGGVTDKSFAKNVQDAVIKQTKAYDRGIKDSETLTVLKYSAMPSVLIEVGFITNENERGNLFDKLYRQKLAKGIAEGILKTFKEMGV